MTSEHGTSTEVILEPGVHGVRHGAAPARVVYLVDPHLRDGLGHYLDYALSIYHEARRRGDGFLAFVPLDATDAVRNALPTEPTFRRLHGYIGSSRHRLLHGLRVGANLMKQSFAVFSALSRVTRRLPRTRSVFFFPNASTMDIIGYALWILWQSRRPEASFVILLRYDYHIRARHRQVLAGWLKLAFWLLRRLRGRGVVRITSDSVPLAELYGELAGGPLEVLPIPHTVEISTPLTSPRAAGTVGACHFVYLGGWRSEQGVRDLVDALLTLRSEFGEGRFTATIQANPLPQDTDAQASRERLKAASIPGVELLEEVLGRERFLECLASADVVLAPYESDAYRYRTSGIFAEAVALGKPVITTRGSWMSGEMSGDEVLLFESGVPEDLARAMRAAATHLGELRAHAASRQVAWTEFHNPRSFYGLLVRQSDERVGTAWSGPSSLRLQVD